MEFIRFRCPKCHGTRLSGVAEITQEWEMNSDGEFVRCINAHIETIHAPDYGDTWECMTCGYSAKGLDFCANIYI